MPYRIKRYSGPRHTTPKHTTAPSNRQERRALHTGSKAWRAQRMRVLIRDRYTCQALACGQWGDQVDHIHGNASEMVSDDQLQTLCLRCHSAKTAKENHGFGNA